MTILHSPICFVGEKQQETILSKPLIHWGWNSQPVYNSEIEEFQKLDGNHFILQLTSRCWLSFVRSLREGFFWSVCVCVCIHACVCFFSFLYISVSICLFFLLKRIAIHFNKDSKTLLLSNASNLCLNEPSAALSYKAPLCTVRYMSWSSEGWKNHASLQILSVYRQVAHELWLQCWLRHLLLGGAIKTGKGRWIGRASGNSHPCMKLEYGAEILKF